MSDTSGHTELECRTDSIVIGVRQRQDLGDLGPLMASIQQRGLLQPVTVTPDRVLVCGRRRLEAVKQLGWTTLRVWVRAGLSEGLESLLAQQDENALRKPLSALEEAALYRELKRLKAEDAERRQQETQFGSAPADVAGVSGGADSVPPGTEAGKSRRQAAVVITGNASYSRLEQICEIERLAADRSQPGEVRHVAEAELEAIRNTGVVDPSYQRVKAAQHVAASATTSDDGSDFNELAAEVLAQAKRDRARRIRENRTKRAAAAQNARRSVRSFVLMWAELDGWAAHYDPEQLARELKAEDEDLFRRVLEQTIAFADALTAARSQCAT